MNQWVFSNIFGCFWSILLLGDRTGRSPYLDTDSHELGVSSIVSEQLLAMKHVES